MRIANNIIGEIEERHSMMPIDCFYSRSMILVVLNFRHYKQGAT